MLLPLLCTFAILPISNLGGWPTSVDARRAGWRECFYDLKREPRSLLDKPYHALISYLPRAALDAIADEQDENPLE
jgi:hypothetical protein